MKPLAGIVVLDLSSNIAGPVATLTLARLGARIIKVERPHGDPSRQWAPKVSGTSLVFDSLNRGKESISLDLSSAAGRELLDTLLRHSDVLIHNFTPDVCAKLRIGEAAVRAVNPDLIYCGVGAFGAGPFGAPLPGYDGVAQAFTGIMEMTGPPGSAPIRCAPAVVDISTGQWTVIALLAALMARSAGQPAATLETTLVDTAIGLVPYQAVEALLTGERPPKYGTGSPLGAPHEVFTAEDRPIFIGAPSEHLWRTLAADVLGAPELLDDERFISGQDRLDNIDALRQELNSRLSRAPARHWQKRLAVTGIPHAEVLGLEEAVAHPLADERRWFESEAGTPVVRLPFLVNGDIVSTAPSAPTLGSHTRAVLSEIGISSDQIDKFAAEGSVVLARTAGEHP